MRWIITTRMGVFAMGLALLGGAAVAEDDAKLPKKPGTPINLQVVFSRFQGEKKIASIPYTLSLTANGEVSRLHMGIQVPLKYEGSDFPGNAVYKNVGNRVSCSAELLDDGRFKIPCQFDWFSISTDDRERTGPASSDADARPLPPTLRNFTLEATLVLRDGQSAQTAASDPVSGDVIKLDVKLSVSE
ncbi:MAG: hypothetical protein HYX75_18890 [Acidobacteria bacterium]|nr:hypothetical protein [Acidobacteriota bacterium]